MQLETVRRRAAVFGPTIFRPDRGNGCARLVRAKANFKRHTLTSGFPLSFSDGWHVAPTTSNLWFETGGVAAR